MERKMALKESKQSMNTYRDLRSDIGKMYVSTCKNIFRDNFTKLVMMINVDSLTDIQWVYIWGPRRNYKSYNV